MNNQEARRAEHEARRSTGTQVVKDSSGVAGYLGAMAYLNARSRPPAGVLPEDVARDEWSAQENLEDAAEEPVQRGVRGDARWFIDMLLGGGSRA
ncbi:MAG: hypothetical protein J2P15_19890 [Micromonosporaceae bacterium]|nr:hypothetical protein [Micromonosporaceae bacterium]